MIPRAKNQTRVNLHVIDAAELSVPEIIVFLHDSKGRFNFGTDTRFFLRTATIFGVFTGLLFRMEFASFFKIFKPRPILSRKISVIPVKISYSGERLVLFHG